MAPAMDGIQPIAPVSSIPGRRSRLRGRVTKQAHGRKLQPIHQQVARSLEDPVVADRTDKPLDRTNICEEILAEGFVQSYVDFFYLTHRPEPNASPDVEAQEINVSEKEMLFIRDSLTQAEHARRQGDTATVYKAYSSLAQHYHQVGDPRTSVYFYEKCLEIARLTGDKQGEMAANHDLGLIYQSLDDVETAAAYHERHLDLSTSLDEQQEEAVAARELVNVYHKLAEKADKAKDNETSVSFYQKCLDSARLAGERKAEGIANYRLGRTYIMLGECQRAISFLEDYESICLDLNDREGQGQASAALAAAYQAVQDDDRALGYLEACLEIATETENLTAQGEACCSLGVIYNKRADFAKAVEYFERNFEVSRAVVASGVRSTTLIDSSRVYLGMARANAMLNQYVHCIHHDVQGLLDWKIKRQVPGSS